MSTGEMESLKSEIKELTRRLAQLERTHLETLRLASQQNGTLLRMLLQARDALRGNGRLPVETPDPPSVLVPPVDGHRYRASQV
jgi:hypothetical protein